MIGIIIWGILIFIIACVACPGFICALFGGLFAGFVVMVIGHIAEEWIAKKRNRRF